MGAIVARAQIDNGYRVWNSKGRPVLQLMVDKLYQVLWRPRPATLLSEEELKDIKKSVKDKYAKQFETMDEEIRKENLTGAAKERRLISDQWRAMRARMVQAYKAAAPAPPLPRLSVMRPHAHPCVPHSVP